MTKKTKRKKRPIDYILTVILILAIGVFFCGVQSNPYLSGIQKKERMSIMRLKRWR